MTQEDKQLLLKDLCARLPYGVVIHTDWKDVKLDRDHCGIGMLYYEHYSEEAKKECGYDENDCSIIISGCYYGDIKPYLRPMSSMTEEEKKEYHAIIMQSQDCSFENGESATTMVNDWLLSKHFDVRGLIPKGLALEAPEKIYLFENPIDCTPDYRWLSKRSCGDDVEYTRIDAFIERAEEFIYIALNDGIMGTANIEDFMKLFKKYMKEE